MGPIYRGLPRYRDDAGDSYLAPWSKRLFSARAKYFLEIAPLSVQGVR